MPACTRAIVFFALIADDVLYLKVDDDNRPEFEARGMPPFRPFGEGGEVMQYYQLPEELLEDPEAMKPWVEKAIAVAARKKKGRKPEPTRPKTKDRGRKPRKPKAARKAKPGPKPKPRPKP